MEDIIQVEKRIGAMQRQGGTVAYRRRIGNEEDYIEPSACSESGEIFYIKILFIQEHRILKNRNIQGTLCSCNGGGNVLTCLITKNDKMKS